VFDIIDARCNHEDHKDILRVGKLKSSIIRNLLLVGHQVLMDCEMKQGNVDIRK
jgi:hypothetical protein